MTNTLRLPEWLAVIRDEYLCGLIEDGGTSIKFAVPTGRLSIDGVLADVAKLSEENGYLVTRLDASITRVHIAEEIFFRSPYKSPGAAWPSKWC